MKNINIKTLIYVVLIISLVFSVLLFRLCGMELSLTSFLKILPKIVLLDALVFTVFSKWLWKWPIFQSWLIPFPDLSGTWYGCIKSDWVDPSTNMKISPIPCILTVKQSFLKISCLMRTQEMNSFSYNESFKIDEDNQTRQLIYSYSSKPVPSVKNRSPQHDGTIIFSIISKEKRKLIGEYWTARNTKGEVELTFKTKEIIEEMPTDLPDHPLNKEKL